MLTHEQQQKAIGTLLKRKENSLCADCNSKMPCWASLDFGVFVCLNCSGAHRALGPSITRVKSARLDTWSREWLENMLIGNSTLNQYWEAGLTQSDRRVKPNTNSSLDAIIKYVQDKYVRKLYVDPNQQLDPLKKAKSGQGIKSQITGEQKQKPKLITGKTPKSTVVEGESINKVNGKGTADFTVFDQFVKVEKPKGENLISFEEEKGKSIKRNATFDDFQFIVPNVKPKEETYNKQQFMSMGGIQSSKIKHQINFQGFSKIQHKDNAYQHKNLLNFETNVNNKTQPNHQLDFNNYGLSTYTNIHSNAHHANQHYQNQHHHQLNMGHYNKHTYSTMGGMHPSSKTDSQLTNYNKEVHHFQHHHQTKKNGLGFQNGNLNYSQGVSLTPQRVQKMKTNENKITLQANINFDDLKKDVAKPQKDVKSWIDDWK